ncbi:MAG: hypothetical protein JXQ27_00180 [Acidobacteria bacterium]|nr:hypothetical protein [Acidobacteriota bacterium]
MKFHRCLVAGLLLTAFVCGAPEEGQKKLLEQGRMIIYFRDTEVGYEQYSFYQDGKDHFVMETLSEFTLPKGAGNMFFRYQTSERMGKQYQPIYYDENFWVNGAESYLHVKFGKDGASDNAYMGGRVLNRTAELSGPIRILEEAVFSLYYPLVLRYDQLSGENKQEMLVYIPKIAQELTATIEAAGDSTVTTALGEMRLQRYFITIGAFQGVTLTTNEKKQLIQIIIPRQELTLSRDFAFDLKQTQPEPPTE